MTLCQFFSSTPLTRFVHVCEKIDSCFHHQSAADFYVLQIKRKISRFLFFFPAACLPACWVNHLAIISESIFSSTSDFRGHILEYYERSHFGVWLFLHPKFISPKLPLHNSVDLEWCLLQLLSLLISQIDELSRMHTCMFKYERRTMSKQKSLLCSLMLIVCKLLSSFQVNFSQDFLIHNSDL
jgi:hypothetical protein